jgi:hypothetical protein
LDGPAHIGNVQTTAGLAHVGNGQTTTEAQGNETMTELEEKEKQLARKGWRQKDCLSPWRWFDPRMPAAFYTLNDAYDISRQKTTASDSSH